MKPKVPYVCYDRSYSSSEVVVYCWGTVNHDADRWLLSDIEVDDRDEIIHEGLHYLVDIDLILNKNTLIHY